MHTSETAAPSTAALGATRSIALWTAVLLSGAMVMLYEFVAARILQRYFGSSLDVWASVISVMMAALSLGYATGGMVADRRGSFAPLGWAMIIAGVTGAGMEVLAALVGERLPEIEVARVLHPYIASGLVSFVPIFALGSVLPQAIRLYAGHARGVGSAAGRISAVSTFGSIVGVVLTVHVFLVHVGVRETLYGASAVLAVTGLVVALLPKPRLAAALAAALFWPHPANAQILYDNYSAYHHILVEDVGRERHLRFDNAVQSTMALDNIYSGGFEYTDFFHIPKVLYPQINSALFIGLGGGTGPKTFLAAYPTMTLQAVEIDPAVVQVAAKFFGLPQDPRLTVIVDDGRTYVQRGKSIYGTIVVDAYASGPYGPYLPYHLATQEFLKAAWKRLINGGSLVYNVVGKHNNVYQEGVYSMHATLASVFQAVYVFEARSTINTVFVAQKIEGAATAETAAWPNGPVLKVLNPQELAQSTQTLVDGGLLIFPNLAARAKQLGPMNGKVPPVPAFTDDRTSADIAPGSR